MSSSQSGLNHAIDDDGGQFSICLLLSFDLIDDLSAEAFYVTARTYQS